MCIKCLPRRRTKSKAGNPFPPVSHQTLFELENVTSKMLNGACNWALTPDDLSLFFTPTRLVNVFASFLPTIPYWQWQQFGLNIIISNKSALCWIINLGWERVASHTVKKVQMRQRNSYVLQKDSDLLTL